LSPALLSRCPVRICLSRREFGLIVSPGANEPSWKLRQPVCAKITYDDGIWACVDTKALLDDGFVENVVPD